MPSSAGVGAANQQLGNIQGLINFFLQLAQGNSNVASQVFQQFLSGSGPFQDNPNFGMTGLDNLLNQTQGFRQGLTNPLTNLQLPPQIQSLLDQLQGPMNSANFALQQGGQTGDTQALRQMFTNIAQGNTGWQAPVLEYANGVLGHQGLTPSMAGALETAQGLTNYGGMTGNLANMADVGNGIVTNRGYGPETQGAMDFFSKIMANGGRDAGTQALVGQGKGLMDSGGFTPQMTGLLGQLQQGMASGGMTPESKALYDKVMGIVNANGQGGSLLPMNTVLSMARDDAATKTAQTASAAQRLALQHQGSAVGAGNVNDIMAEFSDKGMQSEAKAVRDAAGSQQELQLKQLLGALGIGGDLTKSAQTLLGQYAGDATDLMRAASGNIATGAGLMGQGESLAAQRMGQGITGFQDTVQNSLARLGLGSDMVSKAQTAANQRMGLGLESLRGINQDAFGNQNNAAGLLNTLTGQGLSAGQGLAGIAGLEFGHENDAYRNLLGLAGLGNSMYTGQQGMALQSNAQYIDAFLKSLGISSDMTNAFSNQWLSAGNGLTNIAQLYSSLVPSGMNAYGSLSNALVQASMQPGFWGQFAQNLLNGGVSAGMGLLGGWAKKGLGITNGSERGSGQ